jgi:hypothetical protein
VNSVDIENFISKSAGFNFTKIFDQYLRNTQIPSFVYQYDEKEKILTYQWKNCVVGFNLPLALNYKGKKYQLNPMDYIPQKKLINQADFDIKEFVKLINRLYYVNTVIEN